MLTLERFAHLLAESGGELSEAPAQCGRRARRAERGGLGAGRRDLMPEQASDQNETGKEPEYGRHVRSYPSRRPARGQFTARPVAAPYTPVPRPGSPGGTAARC